jgi:hypothetical protein
MSTFKLGARVRHAVFGDGTVLEQSEQHIVIHFDDQGRKKLATALAHLVESDAPQPSANKRAAWTLPRQQVSPPPAPSAAQPGMPGSIQGLMEMSAREVRSEETLNQFISKMRRGLPGPKQQYIGLLSGMRVQEFQNWLLDENPKYQLTDAQLLAVMRVEFPLASGLVFTGDVDTGLQHLAGIRAHYNRDGHNGPSPASRRVPPSRSYGDY